MIDKLVNESLRQCEELIAKFFKVTGLKFYITIEVPEEAWVDILRFCDENYRIRPCYNHQERTEEFTVGKVSFRLIPKRRGQRD